MQAIRRIGVLALLIVLPTLLAACGGGGGGGGATATLPATTAQGSSESAPIVAEPENPEKTFPTSLHATGRGKKTWWAAENGGFQNLVPNHMEYMDLDCKNCHQPNCNNCHDEKTPFQKVSQSKCTGCHSRTNVEAANYTDVHRTAGMECMSCHTKREMHGDGTEYPSMLTPGAMDVSCSASSCHADNGPKPLTYHPVDPHNGKLDCSACHVQSVVSCYNCHFDQEIAHKGKYPYGQMKDWVFLVNWKNKVYTGNFQSVKVGSGDEAKTFVALGPFFGHTVTKEGRGCADCHNSTALSQYLNTGEIKVVTWNTATKKLENIKGVVPVPPDFQTSLKFDFVDSTDFDATGKPKPGSWFFLKSGADAIQMLPEQYGAGSPLTEEQIKHLRDMK